MKKKHRLVEFLSFVLQVEGSCEDKTNKQPKDYKLCCKYHVNVM